MKTTFPVLRDIPEMENPPFLNHDLSFYKIKASIKCYVAQYPNKLPVGYIPIGRRKFLNGPKAVLGCIWEGEGDRTCVSYEMWEHFRNRAWPWPLEVEGKSTESRIVVIRRLDKAAA